MSKGLSLQDLISMSKERVITEKQYQLGLALGLPVAKETLQSEFKEMMDSRKRITLNPKECYTLLEKMDHSTICQILRRQIQYVSEITYQEYQTLMNVADSPRRLWISSQNHPVKMTTNWEYGWQKSDVCRDGKLWYLKSHIYFMADIDTGESLGDIKTRLYSLAAEYMLTFRLYKTYAGYHVHLTSHTMNADSERSSELMSLLKGDIWYSIYSQRCGYKIRLSPKLRDGKTDEVGKYIATIGKEPELPVVLTYLDLMSEFIFWHENSNEPWLV